MIVLQADCVVIETETVRAEMISKALNRYGLNVNEEEIFECLCDVSDDAAIRLIDRHFSHLLPNSIFEILEQLKISWNCLDLRPVKYATEFLSWLPRPSSIISAIEREPVTTRLFRAGVVLPADSHFIYSVSHESHDDLVSAFADITKSFISDLSRCIIVSGSPAEIQAGKSLGMRAIGFLGSSSSPTWLAGALISAGADEVVCDLHNLKRAIIRSQYLRHEAYWSSPVTESRDECLVQADLYHENQDGPIIQIAALNAAAEEITLPRWLTPRQ